MSLSQLIKQMQEKGLVSVGNLRFVGKADPTFNMLKIMADTHELDRKKLQGRIEQCEN